MQRAEHEASDVPLPVRVGNRLLVVIEDVIYVSIAALLAVSALVVSLRTAQLLFDKADERSTEPMLEVLDGLLLIFIFVELLYAVRSTLRERQIVAEPFLIAGVLVCIKEIIVLAVKAPNEYLDKGPEFARAMVEIGLLGGLVLLLTASSVLLRRKEREPEENSNKKA